MDEHVINITIVDGAAQTLHRLMEQDGRDPGATVGEAIGVYTMVREELWAGSQFFVSKDGGITHHQIAFSFQPPRVPVRPEFFSWLGGSAYFPLLAGLIITTCSAIITALVVGGDAFRFATITVWVSCALCALLGGMAWFLTRRTKKLA